MKEVNIPADTVVDVYADGLLNISFDHFESYENVRDGKLLLRSGKYTIIATVYANGRVPSFLMDSERIVTDHTWKATCNDGDEVFAKKLKIPKEIYPSDYRLPTKRVYPERIIEYKGKKLYDFGRELIGFVYLKGIRGEGMICYGESEEEAADENFCEQIDIITGCERDHTTIETKAFRFLSLTDGCAAEEVSALEEYADLELRADFDCSDRLLNRIFTTSVYTLRLNTREFFLDGIKRDRWVWAGDATQSYLMNYYSFNETETVRRTILALMGRPPYNMHINHIMDYTFYWIPALGDYLRYTGDIEFIRGIYKNAVKLIEFCIGRTNKTDLWRGLRMIGFLSIGRMKLIIEVRLRLNRCCMRQLLRSWQI